MLTQYIKVPCNMQQHSPGLMLPAWPPEAVVDCLGLVQTLDCGP